MKCDKLFKDAFEGIEFRYKLDDTLEGLGTQKLTAKQLEGYLLGKGVSPKEIKQSGIFKGFEDDNRAISGDDWLNMSGSQRLTTRYVPQTLYNDISLGRKGADNVTYKETLTSIKEPDTNIPDEPHFEDFAGEDKSLLGWRRSHVDTIDGKKTLVLNEFQSDWAQTERAGRGTFESNNKPKISYEEAIELYYKEKDKFFDTNSNEDDWFTYVNSNTELKDLDNIVHGLTSSQNIVADFPMSEVKHTQYQIVSAINEALKEGINTVAIPIERQNELAGTEGVTKFYDTLNVKILPEIRKKLEKQGLKISVSKKPYKVKPIYNEDVQYKLNSLPTKYKEILTKAYEEHDKEILDYYRYLESDDTDIEDTLLENINDVAQEMYLNPSKDVLNKLWILNIDEVPNNKVKWDVYSVLAALGIGAGATKSEANMPDNPDKYKLSKKVGAKLNYNESDTEVAEYFASIESGGDYNARNKKSSAFGKYQVVKGTLVEKAKDLGISVKEARTPEGQEMVMHSLLGDYKNRLKEFDLPVTKENMFVLHNLGQTGGVRVLRGTYTGEDIKAMRANVSSDERSLPPKELVKAYTNRYNINIPPKQES